MKNKKRLILVSILFTIPLFTSCIPIPNKSSYEDGFQKGYDTGFEAGYNEGITSNDTNKNTTHSKTNESTSNFESGSWNDETFNNYWLNLSFKNPSCSTIATVEEFNSLLGFGAEVSAERNNKNIDAFKKAAEYKIVPGFLTVDAFTNSNVSLLYENLELSVGGSQRTEEDYANIVFETLKNTNTLISQNYVEIADKTFYRNQFKINQSDLYQEQYYYKKDNYMVCITVSYNSDNTDFATKALDCFSTISN